MPLLKSMGFSSLGITAGELSDPASKVHQVVHIFDPIKTVPRKTVLGGFSIPTLSHGGCARSPELSRGFPVHPSDVKTRTPKENTLSCPTPGERANFPALNGSSCLVGAKKP